MDKAMYDRSIADKFNILNAIVELLDTQTFDDLTVSNICDKAHISRTTFYRLFPSKYEVIRWLLQLYSNAGLDQIGRTMTWHEGISFSVFNLGRYRKFLAAANATKHDVVAPHKYAFDHRRQALIETLQEWKHIEITERLLFQVEVWADASTKAAANWYRADIDCSAEEYIRMIESIVPAELYLLLNDPVDPQDKPATKAAMGHDDILIHTYALKMTSKCSKK